MTGSAPARLRALMVTDEKRTKVLPDTPSAAEAGLPMLRPWQNSTPVVGLATGEPVSAHVVRFTPRSR